MRKLLLSMAALTLIAGSSWAQDGQNQRLIVMDEDVWVTFYDLPSRRFRAVRDAFLRRDFESVARDLDISIGFLNVEADRAVTELQPAMMEVVTQLTSMRGRLTDMDLNVGQFDAIFARAHWLLSQHYFVLAMQSRELDMHRNAGRYLMAMAHHLERAVLWSNARIDNDVVESLESIREMAARLQRSDTPERVYRDRPLRLAARTLNRVGEHIDRRVRIRELMPE